MITVIAQVKTTLVSVCAAGAALAAGAFLHRKNSPPNCLTAADCPDCGRNYGPDIFVNIVPIAYRWVPARGHTRESLKLPRVTHLITCPQCLAEYEFHPDGSLFGHPQQGILSCVRTGRTRAIHVPVRWMKAPLVG